MYISRLELQNFRNYKRCNINPSAALTIFTGPNASGKTNILEAIQLIATGSSFKNPHWEDMVLWNHNAAKINTVITDDRFYKEVDLLIKISGERIWNVGGTHCRRLKDATKFISTVLFTPDDLTLIKGSSENRRAQIDALGDQLSQTYQRLRRDYMRVLRQKNNLLREGITDAELLVWNEQIIRLGAKLHLHRRRLAARIREAVIPVYQYLSNGEKLEFIPKGYSGSSPLFLTEDIKISAIEEILQEEIYKRRSEEIERKMSLVGPHRDDFLFLLGDKEARAYASQGQQRTIVLAWKWAEVSVLHEITGQAPILLLDDVMSELDSFRRSALTGLMQEAAQTFITTTTIEYFGKNTLNEANIIDVRDLNI